MSLITKYLDPIRHYSLPGTRALQQELDALREANAALGADLDTVRHDLQHTRDGDEKLLAELRQQIRQIRTERGQAQQQVEQLERSLAHAEHRQKFAESHMDSLEKKLEEERSRHDDNMQVTRTRLVHMQEEQRALLTQQTELTNHLSTELDPAEWAADRDVVELRLSWPAGWELDVLPEAADAQGPAGAAEAPGGQRSMRVSQRQPHRRSTRPEPGKHFLVLCSFNSNLATATGHLNFPINESLMKIRLSKQS